MVLAQLAGGGLGGQAEAGELAQAHETGGHAVVGGPGAQGRAEAAHKTGDVGTHHLTAGEQLEGPQHRVIEEGAALDRDPLAELVGVLELDDLVQGVAHHRIGQARTDLPHGGRLALGLLDRGVHEHRAAAAQIHRPLGVQGGLGELTDLQAHGPGEGLQEGAAAGRTGLIDADGVDRIALDAQVLHVLATDVDDRGDPGIEVGRRPVVRHRLDDALIDAQRRLDQGLPVTGDAGAHDPHAIRHLAVDAPQDLHGGRHRVALVAGVVLPHDPPAPVQDHGLDRRRAGVDPQEAVTVPELPARPRRRVRPLVVDTVELVVRAVRLRSALLGGLLGNRPVGPLNVRAGVPLAEGLQLGGVLEQRAHPGGAQGQGLAGGQTGGQLRDRRRLARGEQGGTDGDVELGVVGAGEGVDLVRQGPLEGGAQLGQEVQRPAQEHDVTADGAPAGQARDGLGDDGLEDGGGQVLPCGTLVDERLEVGLGEDAAARGDGVERRVARGHIVQAGGVGVEELGHLIDEGSGAARAGAVHALLGGGVEVGDLGVLATELDDDVGLRIAHAHRLGLGNDLLDEGQAHEGGQGQPGTAGDRPAHDGARIGPSDLAQQPGQLTAHIRVVAPVLSKHGGHRRHRRRVRPSAGRGRRRVLGKENELDGGRADVQPHPQDCRRAVDPGRHRLRSRPRGRDGFGPPYSGDRSGNGHASPRRVPVPALCEPTTMWAEPSPYRADTHASTVLKYPPSPTAPHHTSWRHNAKRAPRAPRTHTDTLNAVEYRVDRLI